MLKKRVITLLTLNDGVLFRTKRFKPDYRYTLNFVDLDLVDEVVMLDVTPDGEGERKNFYRTMREFTDQCQVPVSVGGKIRDLEEVNRLFGELPVEKVVVERGLYNNPRLGEQIATKWGIQALCAGMTLTDATEWIEFEAGADAGEILVQSVERDGSLLGYDLSWVRDALQLFDVPVIAGSGCGTWKHMKEAFDVGADACATSCIHHFTRNAIKACKEYLLENGVAVRPC